MNRLKIPIPIEVNIEGQSRCYIKAPSIASWWLYCCSAQYPGHWIVESGLFT